MSYIWLTGSSLSSDTLVKSGFTVWKGKAEILLLINQMTNKPKFVQIKAVYPEGYKSLWGHQKAPKTDWWKPEQLDKPQHEWD